MSTRTALLQTGSALPKSIRDARQGDSGRPLVIPVFSSEKDVQVGIVSWAIGFAEPERKFFVEYRRVPLPRQISLLRLAPS